MPVEVVAVRVRASLGHEDLMSAEFFEDQQDLALAGEADDLGRSDRGGVRGSRSGLRTTDPPPAPGVWARCASGEHELCLYELRVNAPWATAGLEAPDPFAEPTSVETCACSCAHVGRAKTLDGGSA